MHKTWNVRDQTEEGLRLEAERLYKQIEAGYKMIKSKNHKRRRRSNDDDEKTKIKKPKTTGVLNPPVVKLA